MTSYVIGEVKILDRAAMQGYGEMIAATVKQYGGRYLARGSEPTVLEGGPAHNILLIEFDTAEAAERWYNSAEYAVAKKLREGHSNLRLILIDGGTKGG